MVTQTPRFDLNKYSQGEDNWSHSDTIDFVDEYSIDKGPVADRPTTGDYDDQLYFATDQGLFWRWDSNVSDWTTDAFGTESNRVPDTSYFDGVDANSVNTEQIGNERRYAGAEDGTDVDARLDSAISAASDGDTIFLESDAYTSDRTISKNLTLIGSGAPIEGTALEATWTFASPVIIQKIVKGSATSGDGIILDSSSSIIQNSSLGAVNFIDVNADNCRIVNVRVGEVTFASGTSGGIVDSSTGITVTDNGSNTVGDIG